jgi:hypothetical protein
MPIDLVALAAEINADPNGYGYSLTDNAATAALLNEARAAIRIDRDVIPAHEVIDALDPAEWAGVTAQEKERIALIVSAGEVNVKSPNTRTAFGTAFGGGTTTRANLLALQTRDGSRAEQLFGQGVTSANVNEALH